MAVKAIGTVGGKQIYEVDSNPITSSTPAPVGTLAIWNDSNLARYFTKLGPANNAWVEQDFFPAFQRSYYKADGVTVPALRSENIGSFAGIYTTDSNSQITIYATSNGAAGGTALFSEIHAPQAICLYNTDSTTRNGSHAILRSISADNKTIVMDLVKGQRQAILIGGNVDTLIPSGSGVKVYVWFQGVLA